MSQASAHKPTRVPTDLPPHSVPFDHGPPLGGAPDPSSPPSITFHFCCFNAHISPAASKGSLNQLENRTFWSSHRTLKSLLHTLPTSCSLIKCSALVCHPTCLELSLLGPDLGVLKSSRPSCSHVTQNRWPILKHLLFLGVPIIIHLGTSSLSTQPFASTWYSPCPLSGPVYLTDPLPYPRNLQRDVGYTQG